MKTVSVVIPVFNQADLIGRAIEAVASNGYLPIEVIVVDDGSDDNIEDVLSSYLPNLPFAIQLLRIPHGGPGRARDAGWRSARGEIVAFTDADAMPSDNWLERGCAKFLSSQVGAVEGAVISGAGTPTLFTHQIHNRFGRQFMTANMFYRRAVIDEVGGFKSPYREDSDLAFSVLEAGYAIPFAEDCVVVHPPREETWHFYFFKANRKRYEGLLFRNHPKVAPQYLPRFQPTELLVIAGELFSLLGLILGVWSLVVGLFFLSLGLPKRLAAWLDGREYGGRDYLVAWILTLALVPVEAYYHWLGILMPPSSDKSQASCKD